MANEVKTITSKYVVDDSGLVKLIKTLQSTEEGTKALEKAAEEAGVSLNELTKTAEKLDKTSGKGFKSLRAQIKEAKNEATALAQQFGETSVQALNAAKRVAQLEEELDDFNQRVKALNPEAKFNAVTNALQGTLGALQGVTGALQLFGAESEEVQQIAVKLQGALNLAQGINSVLGLKDAFGNLRVVLGLTSTAQTALAGATAATTVATEGATAATVGFGAALTATGIGAIVIALGALIAAYVALERQIAADERALERFEKRQKDVLAARELYEDTFNKTLAQRLDLLDFEIEKAEARKASEAEILALQIKRVEAERAALLAATRSGVLLDGAQEKVNIRLRETGQQLDILKIKLANLPREVQRATSEIKPIELLPNETSIEQQTTDALDVVGRTIETKSTDLKLPPFLTEEELKRQEEIVRGSLDVITGLFTSIIVDQQKAAYDQDLANLEEQRSKKLITEEQYEAGLKKLRRRAAEDQKKAAIFQASIDFASALVNALTFKPATGIPAALILANVVAAANLARIIATPIPKFKKGTLNVGGGNMDSDGGSLAILHPGEAVIPAMQNKKYQPAIKAMFENRVDPTAINAFVKNRLDGSLNTSLTATVDPYGLARALKKDKTVNVANVQALGRAIAREFAAQLTPRRS